MVQSFRTKRWNSPPQLRESLPPLALLTHAPLTLEVKLPPRNFELRPAPAQSQVVPPRGEGRQ